MLDIETDSHADTEQTPDGGLILRGGDDEDLANAGPHERGGAVLDHGLVQGRDERLWWLHGGGVDASAATASEDDATGSRRARQKQGEE